MSRIKTHLPLVAMSPKESTLNRTALYKGVRPAHMPQNAGGSTQLDEVIQFMRCAVDLEKGDHVVVTFGDVVGIDGHTNTLKVLEVR